jgi:hypothetical protein
MFLLHSSPSHRAVAFVCLHRLVVFLQPELRIAETELGIQPSRILAQEVGKKLLCVAILFLLQLLITHRQLINSRRSGSSNAGI